MTFPQKLSQEAILAAAMDQVSRHGMERLAIRGVAASLQVAPNALYRYYGNLEMLRAAVSDETRIRLLSHLRKAAGHKSPPEAIRSIAKAYLRFAREQPHLFALTLSPGCSHEEDAVHLESWHFVLDHVAAVYGKPRAPEAAVALWAFLHGITVLETARVFGDKKPASGFAFGLEMWLRSAGEPRRG